MNRLFKNGIVTTVLGIATLGVGVWLYVSKEHNDVEAAAVAGIGLMFLRSKDSLIGIGNKEEK